MGMRCVWERVVCVCVLLLAGGREVVGVGWATGCHPTAVPVCAASNATAHGQGVPQPLRGEALGACIPLSQGSGESWSPRGGEACPRDGWPQRCGHSFQVAPRTQPAGSL